MAEIALKGGHTTDDPRLDRLPEFDPRSREYPIRALVTEQAPLRSRGWACPAWLDQGQEGACFPPGTLVRMAHGSHLPIEQVRTLDLVVTAEGRTSTVLATSARMHVGDLVRVKMHGHRSLRATPEHPVLTQRGYVAVRDLRIGDRVALTRHAARATMATAPLAAHAFQRRSPSHALSRTVRHHDRHGGVTVSRQATVPGELSLDVDAGRLLGLYLAEGGTTENRVVWTFGRHEAETLVPETVALIERVLGGEARVQVRANGTQNVVLYGKPWRLAFEALGGKGVADKRLHPDIAQGSDDFRRALLDGWLAGDGHSRRNGTSGVTVSHCLALDMFAVAQDLGLRPTLTVSDPRPSGPVRSGRRRYDVAFATGGGTNIAPMDDTAVWRRVVGLEAEDFAGYVHNLHVEGDESYVAEGVGVHNCVGFSWSHELCATPVAVKGLDDEFARRIYKNAQQLDEWPGEDYEGTSVLAGAKAVQAEGYMDEYRWAFGVDDALRALGYQGPVVVGIPWYQSMFEPRPSGLLEVAPGGGGGHAILVRGVSLKARLKGEGGPMPVVRLRNSWGRNWGVDGDCYIKVEDFSDLLAAQGDCCVPVIRKDAPAPKPDEAFLAETGEEQ